VGALQLEATKRKFLEARNVAPIDLYPLVRSLDPKEHRAAATKIFLDFLTSMKPVPVSDWTSAGHSAYGFMPTAPADFTRLATDHVYAASLLDQAAKIWEADRLGYPEWLVCPAALRQQLRGQTERYGLVRQTSLNELTPERRAQTLYELAWRHSTAFSPVDAQLAGLFEQGAKLLLRGNTTRLRTHDPLDSASTGCYPRDERYSRCSNAGKRRSWPPLTTWNRGNVG
jgi:hypothetical protein